MTVLLPSATNALNHIPAMVFGPLLSLEVSCILSLNSNLAKPLPVAISKMCQDVRLEEKLGSDESVKSAKKRHGFKLRTLMDAMQQRLEKMTPGSEEHTKYVSFVQPIIAHIRSHADSLQPLTFFFNQEAIYYWQDAHDPRLCVSIITSYCLKIVQSPDKIWALMEYLCLETTGALAAGKVAQHVGHIEQSLLNWTFAKFMLNLYVPAIIKFGFQTDDCWVFASVYLPAIANRVKRLLEKGGPEGALAFQYVVQILEMIIDEMILRSKGQYDENIRGIHPQNRGMNAVVCKFWLSIIQNLRFYVVHNPDMATATGFKPIDWRLAKFGQLAMDAFEANVGEEAHFSMGWMTNVPKSIEDVPMTGVSKSSEKVIPRSSLAGEAHRILTRRITGSFNFPNSRYMDSFMLHKNGWLKISHGTQEQNLSIVLLAELWPPRLREVLAGFPDTLPAPDYGWFSVNAEVEKEDEADMDHDLKAWMERRGDYKLYVKVQKTEDALWLERIDGRP